MGADHSEVDSREQRLDAVLFDYLRAAEAGQAPDREAWLAEYPDLAGELTEFLSEQDRFDRAAAPLRAVVRAAARGEPTDAVPERLGDFRLLREVGRGGMGVVYEAEQMSLGRRVALKVLPFAATMDSRQLQRFQNEGSTAAMLDHPNIVPVYEVGQWQPDGTKTPVPYLAMKLIEGGNLAQKHKGTPWLPWEAARLVEVLSRAVAHAHRRGVVHRDLKPANVLVTADGRPLIADFGLAKRQEIAGPTLNSQVLLGTPTYMAPEQAAGQLKLVGPHTDVHALGAILYELLTGRPPFHGATPLDTLEQVRALEPVPPGRLQPKVPRDLEAVCLKCLQKEPARRYADGKALADDLERFLAGRPTEARPAGVVSRALLWCQRPERVREAGVVVLCLNVVLTFWMCLGLLAVPLGIVEPERPSTLIGEFITRIALVLAPEAWIATKVIQRRSWAIWAGMVFASVQLLATLAFFYLGKPNDMGGLYNHRDPGMSFAFATLLVMFAGAQFLAMACGLAAYRANRQTVAWSRQGPA